MSVCLGKWEMGDGVGDGEGTPDWLVTISFGPKLIEKRVENCIGQQRGNVLGQPAKYSLGLIKHDQPQAADKGTNVRSREQRWTGCPVLPRNRRVEAGVGVGVGVVFSVLESNNPK